MSRVGGSGLEQRAESRLPHVTAPDETGMRVIIQRN